jgi:hypothetical protein
LRFRNSVSRPGPDAERVVKSALVFPSALFEVAASQFDNPCYRYNKDKNLGEAKH